VAPDEHDLFRLRLTGFAVQTLTDLRATLAKAPPVVSNAQADTPVGSDEPLDADTLRQADRDLDDPDLAQAALGLLYRLAGGAR
jgi:hypothetical protein